MTRTAEVYSQPGCVPCVMVKNYLQDKGVTVVVKDVTADEAYFKELLDMGFKSTPVTVVNNIAVEGYNPDRLDQLFPL